MLGVLNANGPSTDKVLGDSALAVAILDDAAASNSRVGVHTGLDMSAGPGFRGRVGDNGAKGFHGHDGHGDPGPTSGHSTHVDGPKTSVSAGASVKGGNVANASAVVAGLAGGFRRCYEAGLSGDNDMRGRFTITARIGPNGEVLSATPSGGGGISGGVQSCAAARVSGASFAPPEGGAGATLVIPVGMEHQ